MILSFAKESDSTLGDSGYLEKELIKLFLTLNIASADYWHPGDQFVGKIPKALARALA